MQKRFLGLSCLMGVVVLCSCSPRDFLTRRLAGDLIVSSNVFKTPQQVSLHTGVVSNKEYLEPEYAALQRHGWITGTNAPCPSQLAPPCWEVLLTPSGVDTVRLFLAAGDADKPTFSVPAAKRELVSVTGISKQGGVADVEFTWRWIPMNEIGAAFYSSDPHYKSTVEFRSYDDGWRVLETASRVAHPLDEALKSAEPSQ